MICLQCDNEEFVLKQDAVIEQEFKGETFHIKMPALACAKCGWITVDTDQADELRKRTADAYRKKHDLLTSEEIKNWRQLLGKTQREFATMLSVGEASVKRWETWLVQEKSSDQLIRLKCDKELRDQLVWMSFEIEITEASKGITIQTGSPTTVTPSSGEVRRDLLEPEKESQMLLCEVTSPDICGPSPPRCDAAFSFSMPSFELFQTEGVEKENAYQPAQMGG
jgi:putative zinc finger/helix-turn-helix YgiT family protein